MLQALEIQDVLEKYGINEELLKVLWETGTYTLLFDDEDTSVGIFVDSCSIYIFNSKNEIIAEEVLTDRYYHYRQKPNPRLKVSKDIEDKDIIFDLDDNLLYFLHKSNLKEAFVLTKTYQCDFEIERTPEKTKITAHIDWGKGNPHNLGITWIHKTATIWIEGDTITSASYV